MEGRAFYKTWKTVVRLLLGIGQMDAKVQGLALGRQPHLPIRNSTHLTQVGQRASAKTLTKCLGIEEKEILGLKQNLESLGCWMSALAFVARLA